MDIKKLATLALPGGGQVLQYSKAYAFEITVIEKKGVTIARFWQMYKAGEGFRHCKTEYQDTRTGKIYQAKSFDVILDTEFAAGFDPMQFAKGIQHIGRQLEEIIRKNRRETIDKIEEDDKQSSQFPEVEDL